MKTEPLQNTEGQGDMPVPTANERWKEGVRKKNPNRAFENEDEYYQASMEGYDAEHERVKSMTAANKSLADRMEADPKAAAAMAEFFEGKPLPVALRKYFDDEELTMGEDDPGYKDYLDAVKERVARAENNKKLQAEYEANLEASQGAFDMFAQEKGMAPEEVDSFVQTATEKIVEPLLKGIISAEWLEMVHKAMNYENDLAVTADTNYKKGKNEKIIENKRAIKSDGLPDTTTGGAAAEAKTPGDPTANALDGILSRSASEDIYSRGGFQRKGK